MDRPPLVRSTSVVCLFAFRRGLCFLGWLRPWCCKTQFRRTPEVRNQKFTDEGHFLWQSVVELEEEVVVHRDLFEPNVPVEVHYLFPLLFREIESAPVHVFVTGHPAERCLGSFRFAPGAFDD